MSKREYKIAPSLLASDFTRLGEECERVLEGGADWLHIDVMDGHYVPNLSFGLPILKALRKRFPKAVMDVHLMITNPDEYVGAYVETGADVVSFHPEVSHHPHRALQTIRERGGKGAIALNPGTPLIQVAELVEELDMVLLMSVNPGFGGQKFIGTTLEKCRRLVELRELTGGVFDIEVDGGVTEENVGEIAKAGANIFVAGSAIFKREDYAETIAKMRSAIEQ